jgi:UDP-glucose 4-epimerase
MRILVTGGAGYIGSITVRRLLDAGHEVVVVDSLVRGHREAVDPRAIFVEGEVGDTAVLGRALPGCDAVMHLAGLIEVAESQSQPGSTSMRTWRNPRECSRRWLPRGPGDRLLVDCGRLRRAIGRAHL